MTPARCGTSLVLLALVGVACGGDGDEFELEEAVVGFIETMCGKAHECREDYAYGTDDEFQDRYGEDAAACVVQASVDETVAAYRASIDAGRIVFDPGAAAECIETTGALACEDMWPDEPGEGATSFACATMFRGQVETGGACVLDEDCMYVASICRDQVCTSAFDG